MSARQRRNLVELARLEMTMQRRVLAVLAGGPLTVVEVAEALGAPADEVLIWMMGMRRYGLLVESREANDEDYYTYAIASGKQEVSQ